MADRCSLSHVLGDGRRSRRRHGHAWAGGSRGRRKRRKRGERGKRGKGAGGGCLEGRPRRRVGDHLAPGRRGLVGSAQTLRGGDGTGVGPGTPRGRGDPFGAAPCAGFGLLIFESVRGADSGRGLVQRRVDALAGGLRPDPHPGDGPVYRDGPHPSDLVPAEALDATDHRARRRARRRFRGTRRRCGRGRRATWRRRPKLRGRTPRTNAMHVQACSMGPRRPRPSAVLAGLSRAGG